MEIDLIFKIAAIGIIVAVLNQLLIRSFLQVKAMTIATIDIGGTGYFNGEAKKQGKEKALA